jgi:hypothetical protein
MPTKPKKSKMLSDKKAVAKKASKPVVAKSKKITKAKPKKAIAKKVTAKKATPKKSAAKKVVGIKKEGLSEGLQAWPILDFVNGHENFEHRFQKDCSFKLMLPDSLPSQKEKYKATTANFQRLIQIAIDKKIQMRAIGNGWSFSKVAICDGGIVGTKALRANFVLKDSMLAQAYLNTGKKGEDVYFVQCGMSILDINEHLQAMGRSIKASGASNGQSLAGATSTGTHGSAFNVGAVHDTILGLHIVVGANRHVWLERKSNPVASDNFIAFLGAEKISDDDMFNAAVVSFGNFGFIHGIMLETEPLFLLEDNKSGEMTYDDNMIKVMNTLDFNLIADKLPHKPGTPGKELYHFEFLVNPHDLEKDNPKKGVYLKTMYKIPFTPNYVKRERESKGFEYGDNMLGLIQRLLDGMGNLAATFVPMLVNTMIPLAFQPQPAQFGTIGETFDNTQIRGTAASAALGINAHDASKVLDLIVEMNKKKPFPGAVALRYVKGSQALMAFTKFPKTCIMELDGVDSKISRDFFKLVWEALEARKIPYTVHWGKINFHMNEERIRNMYGNATIDKWIACRHNLLDADTRKVFTNDFMEACGLAK